MTYGEKPERISIREKISFGLGDFAINGVFTFVSSYLLYFYTDSVRMSLEDSGIIVFLGRMAEAVICIVAGNIMDSVSTRFGKCRPFLIGGGLPMILLMCMLFTMPGFSYTGQIIFGCLTYILFSAVYAFVNVPYSAMLSLVTDRNSERISFNIFKNIGGNAGALVATFLAFHLVDMFGGPQEGGYFKATLVYAACFLTAILVCAYNTKERVCTECATSKNSSAGWKQSLLIAVRNRNWMLFIVIQFTAMFYMIVHNQGTLYFTQYYLKEESLNTILLSLTPLAAIPCAFILPILAGKIGMKRILICGHMLVGVSLIMTAGVGRNVRLVVICGALTSLGWCISSGMIFVILSQLIDWSERESGFRPQGVMTSWMTFFMKAGTAAAGYVVPLILKWGGYTAGSCADEQALQAIRMNYIWIPAVLALGMAVISMMFRLPENTERKEECDDSRKEEGSYI